MDICEAYEYLSRLEPTSPEYKVYSNYIIAACSNYNVENMNKPGFKELDTSVLGVRSKTGYRFKAVLDKVGEYMKDKSLITVEYTALSYVDVGDICLTREICKDFIEFVDEEFSKDSKDIVLNAYRACKNSLGICFSNPSKFYENYEEFLVRYFYCRNAGYSVSSIDKHFSKLIQDIEHKYLMNILESPLRKFRDSVRLREMSLFNDVDETIDCVIEHYKYRMNIIPVFALDKDEALSLCRKESNSILERYKSEKMPLKVAKPLSDSIDIIKNMCTASQPWKMSLVDFMCMYMNGDDLSNYLCNPIRSVRKSYDFAKDVLRICTDENLINLTKNNIRIIFRNMNMDCQANLKKILEQSKNWTTYEDICIDHFSQLLRLGILKSREETLEIISKEVIAYEHNLHKY